MKKKHLGLAIFGVNPLILFCIFFTVSMTLSTLVSAITGTVPISPLVHLLSVAVYCATPLIPFFLFEYIPTPKHTNENSYSFWVSVLLHYLISSGFVVLYIFIWRLIEPTLPITYFNSILSYTQGYILIMSSALGIEFYKTATANKNLQKIRESLSSSQ